MNSNLPFELDVTDLTADDANELRALFTASATASRKSGRSPQESFLISLAGLLDGYLERLAEEQGEIPSEVAEYESARAVDLTLLAGDDLLRGARALLGISEAFEEDGKPALRDTFRGLAGAFGDAFQRRAAETGGHSTAYLDE